MSSRASRASGGGLERVVAEATPALRGIEEQLLALVAEVDFAVGRFAESQGLHPTDVRALFALGAPGEAPTAGELAERLGLTSGAATRLIDRLERAGLVRRERDGVDRRRVLLARTPEVEAAAEAFFGDLERGMRAATDRFAAAELAVVSRFLEAAVASIREERSGRP